MSVPSIPQNFYIQQANGQVFLSWSLVAGATSYNIQRSTDGVTYVSLTSPATNSYLDTTAVIGTNYFYQVAAVNASGTGVYANPASGTLQSVVPTQTGDLSLMEMRYLAQARADRLNSNFVTLPEWNRFLNQSYFEFYDLLETTFEDYFVAVPITITTDGINNRFPLPDGVLYTAAPLFYKLLGVDYGINSNANGFITLNRFNFIDRNNFIYPFQTSPMSLGHNLHYKVMGTNIMFTPTPSAGQSIQLWYTPRLTQLLRDTDIASGISGWLEYVIVDAARKALQKEESDTTSLDNEKLALMSRIQSSAQNRDAGQPATISNTRCSNGDDYGWGI